MFEVRYTVICGVRDQMNLKNNFSTAQRLFPSTIPTGSFLLSDFQGLCLTVDITGASPFSPIITEECSRRLPALPQQTWSLATVNHGRVLVSGLSQEAGETVVVAEGSNGKAITAGGTSFGFNITCVPVDANSVTLVDNLVGTEITLTSSQAEGQGDTAQAAGPVNPFFKLQIAGPSSQSSSSKFNNFHFHDDPQPAPNPPLPSPLATYVQNPPRTSPLFRYQSPLHPTPTPPFPSHTPTAHPRLLL
ncbi:hypothetical protein B0H14DRAFT_3426585 [Mycena olivaceomarginata]|nr:hypothetical protein B0H14DRAFT_3426585 [Mycena olivaceomarginata]